MFTSLIFTSILECYTVCYFDQSLGIIVGILFGWSDCVNPMVYTTGLVNVKNIEGL